MDNINANTNANASAPARDFTPIADGWYTAYPAYTAVNEKDTANYAIRIGWKATATAPRNGDPLPVEDNIEMVFTNEVLVYGPEGQVYDKDTKAMRTATVEDTKAAIARLRKWFPAWADFCDATADNAERLAWFVDHADDFAKCSMILHVSHTTKGDKTYTNGRIYPPNGGNREKRTVDRAELLAKFGKTAKAAFKGFPATTVARTPENAPRSAPSAAPTPTPPPPARAPVPPPATPKAAPKPASVDDAYAEWCKQFPLEANGEAFYAFAEKVIGNADFEAYTPAEWGRVLDEIIPF